MTPIFCCGFECGVDGAHWTSGASFSFSTTTVRSGTRSGHLTPTGTTGFCSLPVNAARFIGRFYIRFAATLPTGVNATFLNLGNSNGPKIRFDPADSKIYAFVGFSVGATGVSVTTDTWYRIDFDLNINTGGNDTADVMVDGVACGQATGTGLSAAATTLNLGFSEANVTADVYVDDFILSNTAADYPIGAGYVNHFVPTADGTHNVAGANDFERSATGTDITNATTTAFQLIDDVPLKSGTVSEYINLIAPPNATDYVEVVFGPASGVSTPTAAPRSAEVIVAYASATAGTNNLRLALNDNGSLDDVLNTTVGPGTTATYARKHYADPPSAATAWTLSGNGNFNNVRMRCLTNDAAPDPWWASAMIEAEFAEVSVVIPNRIFEVRQAINRSSYW